MEARLQATLDIRYKVALDRAEISTDSPPIQFVYPYLKLALEEYYTDFLSLHEAWRPKHDRDISLWDERPGLRSRHKELSNFLAELQNSESFCQGRSSALGCSFEGLITDARTLLSQYDKQIQIQDEQEREFIAREQSHLSETQLMDSRKSIEASVGVARLSKLAFVFIPLNFVCAMFGMNLSIFSTGSVPLWMFFLAAAMCTAVITIPIWNLIIKSIKKNTIDIRLASQLFWRSPIIGFWYAASQLTHCERWKFRKCGIEQVLIGHQKSPGPFFAGMEGYRIRILHGRSEFWKCKIRLIFEYIDAPGWEDSSSFLYFWFIGIKPYAERKIAVYPRSREFRKSLRAIESASTTG